MSEENKETNSIHKGVYKDKQYGSISTPIYQTSTFIANTRPLIESEECDSYAYSRFGNPTRAALEENLAAIEGGIKAFATNSGISAMQMVLMLLRQGDHIICSKQVFAGTYTLIDTIMGKFGVECTFFDLTDIEGLKEEVRGNTKMIWMETPTNPTMEVINIKEVVEIARYAEAWTVLDNSLMSPMGQSPFEFGVDIIVHSTSKSINGHSDVVGGGVIVRTEDVAKELTFLSGALGVGQAPMDSWLVLRGMKTMPARMRVHEENTIKVAEFLQSHARIKKVNYPGLKSDRGHELAKKQQKLFGPILSFEVHEEVDLKVFVDALKYVKFSYSLGGVESIVSHPWSQSHGRLTEEKRLEMGVNPRLMRLSVGIENCEDLINDLKNALDHAANSVSHFCEH